MRHDDDRLADVRLNAPEFGVQLRARQRIERAEWLVHQQYWRIDGEGARDPDALPLAPGELVGPTPGELLSVQADELEQRRDPSVDTLFRPALEARNDPDVPADCHMRKQSHLLQYISDAAPEADGVPLARVTPFDQHRAIPGKEQAVYQFEQRRFTRPAAADHGDDFACLNGQIEAVEHVRSTRPREADRAEFDGGNGHRACDGSTGTLHNATNSGGPQTRRRS